MGIQPGEDNELVGKSPAEGILAKPPIEISDIGNAVSGIANSVFEAVKNVFTQPWVPESSWDRKEIERQAAGGEQTQTTVRNDIKVDVNIDGRNIPAQTNVTEQQHYNSGSPLLMPSH
jgi:hypothetical protein